MRLDRLDYELPEELIADRPAEERDGARLLVVPKGDSAPFEHRAIRDLPDLIPPGALLVANDTRVVPARLFGRKATGGKVEVFLVERSASDATSETWVALVRSSKGTNAGALLEIEGAGDIECTLLERLEDPPGAFVVRFAARGDVDVAKAIERAGHVPLPPYIRRADEAADRDRYQTVFARRPGAVAAPTAGLHLSERLLEALGRRGVEMTYVTLHVSLGTFQPVKVDDLDQHPMHAETFEVGADAERAIDAARARGAPVVAIGTTAVRALESAATAGRRVTPKRDRTRLLIQPGYAFRVVDALLTNFHLPRSTLLALVGAFSGLDRVLAAYREAVAHRYRFFSYGDAMLLGLPPSKEGA